MAIALTQTAFNPITGVFGSGNVQVFGGKGTATGSYTWTVPPGVAKVRVRVWSAGGGNGGSGGGFAMKTIFDLTGVSTVAVTVGAGAVNTTGGTSSFGSYVSVTGGAANGGSAGSSTSGDINQSGGLGVSSCGGGGVGSLFGDGGSSAGTVGNSGASGGGGTGSSTAYGGGSGLFGSAGQYISSGTSAALVTPTTGLIGQFSIDFIGTGGGGAYNQSGANGGGGGQGGSGGYPGGGGGINSGSNAGAAGMVIVEW